MLLNKKKYDLIFGIGEACSCTQSLRKYNLQIRSFPFDWLYGSDFLRRCQIIAQRFDRFIDINDLKDTGKVNNDKNNPCKVYNNIHNDITFNHDFFITEDFNTIYPIVKEKYNRRIKRLLKNFETSKNILIVYMEPPTSDHPKIENNTIIEGYNLIQKTFLNADIDLIYIQNSNSPQKQEILSNHIFKFILPYKNTQNDSVDHAVDLTKLEHIFTKYELNIPYIFYLIRKIQKCLINLIPLKFVRIKLKKKYHI